MNQGLPMMPIDRNQLRSLISALQLYRRFRLLRTASTEERRFTLTVLLLLLPRLQQSAMSDEENFPVLLTVDEVRVMKGGLNTLLDLANRSPFAAHLKQEQASLKFLKALLDQHFSTEEA